MSNRGVEAQVSPGPDGQDRGEEVATSKSTRVATSKPTGMRQSCSGGLLANLEWGEWEEIPCGITIDSGAAETVMPEKMAKKYEIMPSIGSEAGVEYVSATGEPIPNLGEKCLNLMTPDGSMRMMTMQVAKGVSKALGSVSRICAAGHKVVFDDQGSYIEHKQTGHLTWLMQENGVYVLDAWIAPPSAQAKKSGFTRQEESR